MKRTALLCLILAGCGGGSESVTPAAVSPTQPPARDEVNGPTALVQAPESVQRAPVVSAPVPVAVEAPAAAAVVLEGIEVFSAVKNGIPLSAEVPPIQAGNLNMWINEHTRKAVSRDGQEILVRMNVFSDGMSSYFARPRPEGGSLLSGVVGINTEFNGNAVRVIDINNSIAFNQEWVELTGKIELDKPLGEWETDGALVRLIPQSVNGRSDLLRICWETVVQTINRTTCGIHRKDGDDVGAVVIDNGIVYQGEWI